MKLIIDIPEEYKEQFIKNKCDDLFNSLATNEFGYVLRKSFETATLETQPCEDCISRQRVLDIINFEYKWLLDAKVYDICTSIAFSAIMSKISEMPSVTPTRPTGKWIRDTITDLYHCSECRTIYHQDVKTMDNFCPNCGARMVESEDEE